MTNKSASTNKRLHRLISRATLRDSDAVSQLIPMYMMYWCNSFEMSRIWICMYKSSDLYFRIFDMTRILRARCKAALHSRNPQTRTLRQETHTFICTLPILPWRVVKYLTSVRRKACWSARMFFFSFFCTNILSQKNEQFEQVIKSLILPWHLCLCEYKHLHKALITMNKNIDN